MAASFHSGCGFGSVSLEDRCRSFQRASLPASPSGSSKKYVPFGSTCLCGNSEICAGTASSTLSPPSAETFDSAVDLQGVQIQDDVRSQAEAAGLVHDFLVVSRAELALVREKNPSRRNVCDPRSV